MKNAISSIRSFLGSMPALYAAAALVVGGAILWLGHQIEARDNRIRAGVVAKASADSARAVIRLRDSLYQANRAELAREKARADSIAKVSSAQAKSAIRRWQALRDSIKAGARIDTGTVAAADTAITYCAAALGDCERARIVADSIIAAERADKERIRSERDSLNKPRPPVIEPSKAASKVKKVGIVGTGVAAGVLLCKFLGGCR